MANYVKLHYILGHRGDAYMTSPLEAMYEAMYAIIVVILDHRWDIQMLAIDGHMSECVASRLPLNSPSVLIFQQSRSWLIALS